MKYNVNNENERIIIGEVGENLAESCTIDYSAWVEEYGEGNLRIRAIREGDAEPYPVANVETADGVATWTYTAADTAVKGFGEVQVLYYVGDVLAKSRVWKTYTYRSLSTSSEEVPDPYADWLNAVERLGGQVEADAEAASVSADSASASATLAAGSASEAAESALSASRSASAALGSASAASSSADSAASSATAASQSATEASNYEYYSEQYMNEAKSAKFGAESARTGAENAKAAAQASATAAAQSAEQAEETAESIESSADLIQKLMDNQIKDTATGTIASFPDGADMPMVSLVADIDPVQDTSGGAPSPSNVRPISGWDEVETHKAGVNLFDKSDSSKVISGLYIDNGKVIGGSTSRTLAYIPCKPNTTYTVQRIRYDSNTRFMWGWSKELPQRDTSVFDVGSGGNSGTIGQKTTVTVTTGADAKYLVGWISWDSTLLENELNTLQIELGSTATAYHPYDGQTITTTLPQTVYGGTLDVVSGELVVDRVAVDMGTLNWSFWQQSATQNTFYVNVTDKAVGKKNILSSAFEVLASGGYGELANGQIVGTDGNTYVYLVDNRFTNVADFKSAVSGQTLVYELATHTTIQLTATEVSSLLGDNNVWADSGDVTVEYIADTKLYIQKVIS